MTGRSASAWRGRIGGVLLLVAGTMVPGWPARPSEHDPQCPRWRRAFLGMEARTLVVGGEAAGVKIPVRLAATGEARRAGFQCATAEEIETAVILFDFGTEVMRGFHMWNVRAPLDIAFAKADGRIVSILRMESGAREAHGPMAWFRYAIEARAGYFTERGIAVGHVVRLEPRG